jgi:hypothetical protein
MKWEKFSEAKACWECNKISKLIYGKGNWNSNKCKGWENTKIIGKYRKFQENLKNKIFSLLSLQKVFLINNKFFQNPSLPPLKIFIQEEDTNQNDMAGNEIYLSVETCKFIATSSQTLLTVFAIHEIYLPLIMLDTPEWG